jgi:hypothetical protein
MASQAIAPQDGQDLRLEIDRLVALQILHFESLTKRGAGQQEESY